MHKDCSDETEYAKRDNKALIVEQTGSIYWLKGEDIVYVPISRYNTFDFSEQTIVDEDLIEDELLPEPYYKAKTFKELFVYIREILK